MGNKDREINDEKIIQDILNNGKYTTIALSNNKQPYIVTLSYGYDPENKCLYFHCSNKGYKLDIIKNNPNACATIIEDHGYVINDCSHKYRSLIIWGNLHKIEDINEKEHAFDVMFAHLEKDNKTIKSQSFKDPSTYDKVCVLKLNIDAIDAKGNVKPE